MENENIKTEIVVKNAKKGMRTRIILIVSAVCVAAGGVTAFLLLRNRNKGNRTVALPGNSISFVYNDGWFEKSSDLENQHLATLSAIMSYESQDPAEAVAMLTAMEYADVKQNGNAEILESSPKSVTVNVGHKVSDGDATLLAVSVRSSQYSLEWAGNMMVGKGAMHEGFKGARDEVLRYLKKYIAEQNITGRIKLWICGQGQAGAVSNLVAAYFADGGYGYFEGVTIDPEDVYGYTFGSPRTVVKGKLTKEAAGSVEAARQDAWYEADSPGDAYLYSGADAADVIDHTAKQFQGIYNYQHDFDFLAQMPLADWDYDLFGRNMQLDYSSLEDEMMTYLASFGKDSVDSYKKYAGDANYIWKTLDPNTFSFVEDTSVEESISQADMYKSRIDGMMHFVGSQENYVDGGYEKALTGLAGIYGVVGRDLRKAITDDSAAFYKAVLYSFVCYLEQWYKEEMGQELSDEEAMTLILTTILGYVTGETYDPETITVDDLLYVLSKYVVDHMEPQYDPEHPGDLTKVTGFTYSSKMAKMFFRMIRKQMEELILGENPNAEMYSLLVRCAYGKMEDKGNVSGPEPGKTSREQVFLLVSILFPSSDSEIGNVIGTDGKGTVRKLYEAAMPLILSGKDSEGKNVRYENLEAAADALVGNLFQRALKKLVKSGKLLPDDKKTQILNSYVKDIAENAGALREILCGLLLYSSGDTFDFEEWIRTTATFAGQRKAILYSHWPQFYAAWLMAADDLYPCEE